MQKHTNTKKGVISMDKGLNIQGLDTAQISEKLSVYVENHIRGFMLSDGESLFQENYLLSFDECKDAIPSKYHHLFTDTDMLNGLSGFIKAGAKQYIVMLLVDEAFTKAYLLSMQGAGAEGSDETVIIADFLCP